MGNSFDVLSRSSDLMAKLIFLKKEIGKVQFSDVVSQKNELRKFREDP